MGMPESSVVPLVQRVVRVVMRDMEVVVSVRPSCVRVLRLLALTLGVLSLAGAWPGLHGCGLLYLSISRQTPCRFVGHGQPQRPLMLLAAARVLRLAGDAVGHGDRLIVARCR